MTLAALPAHGRSDSGTGNSPSQGVKPDMPDDLSITVTNLDAETAEVTADWSSVGDAEQYSWESAYDTGENTKNDSVAIPTTSVTFQMKRSGSAEDCYFCVEADNRAGSGEQLCDGYTLDAQDTSSAPTAPSGLTATAGDQSVGLSWDDNSSDESGFRIYRDGSEIADSPVGADVTNYTDDGRMNGTEYCYEVSAYNSSGESAKAGPACATPTATEAGTADIEDDFSSYGSDADWKDSTLWVFPDTQYHDPADLELDTSEGVPALNTSQAGRWQFPGDGSTNTVRADIPHKHVWEVWYEWWGKFSADFTTDWNVDGKIPAYKYIFVTIENPQATKESRYHFVNGHYMYNYVVQDPAESVPTPDTTPALYEEEGADEYDGEWHKYRLHCRVESSLDAGDGAFEGAIACESGGKNRQWSFDPSGAGGYDGGKITGLSIGRNMNEGPTEPIHHKIGQVKVYFSDPGWTFNHDAGWD